MGIENKRYEIPRGKGQLLDEIDAFFRKKLGRRQYALRYAIVEAAGKKVQIEATIAEEQK